MPNRKHAASVHVAVSTLLEARGSEPVHGFCVVSIAFYSAAPHFCSARASVAARLLWRRTVSGRPTHWFSIGRETPLKSTAITACVCNSS